MNVSDRFLQIQVEIAIRYQVLINIFIYQSNLLLS